MLRWLSFGGRFPGVIRCTHCRSGQPDSVNVPLGFVSRESDEVSKSFALDRLRLAPQAFQIGNQ